MPAEIAPKVSIVIPAHNEANAIGRCLSGLLADSMPGEFDIVVVCNGCADDTAKIAASFGTRVRVFDLITASKVAALNFGDQAARTYPRVYLDSDLVISGSDIRSLVSLLDENTLAAVGHMDVQLEERSWPIKSFYRIWARNPYLTAGKFGGVYALSEEGCKKRGPYPDIIADDGFAKNAFDSTECKSDHGCRFTVSPPATVKDLLRIRTRVHLGNLQLKSMENKHGEPSDAHQNRWLFNALRSPGLWPAIGVYLSINLAARVAAKYRHQREDYRWLRDESSRARISARVST